MHEVSDLDLQILKELRSDGRMSYRSLAQKIGVATGTVQNRVEKMLDEGIIKKFRASINYTKVGFTVTAIIGVSVAKRNQLMKVEHELSKYKNIFNVYTVTGEYDILMSGRFKSMSELNKFVRKDIAALPISNSTTFLVLDTTKEEFTLPLRD